MEQEVVYDKTCNLYFADWPRTNFTLMSSLPRVIFGTAVFAAIPWAAAPYPAAAGLMLTFPALNGLAFLFAGRDDITRLTGSMLWMPLLNGFLCAGYLSLFLYLAAPEYDRLLAWGLTGSVN